MGASGGHGSIDPLGSPSGVAGAMAWAASAVMRNTGVMSK